MCHAIKFVCKNSCNNGEMKLGMSFMKRDEKAVLNTFSVFKLELTNFNLEYATVEPNRWDNYCWWANTDLPMIKRV